MTSRLSFIDRFKALLGDLGRGKSVALNRPPSYEIEILPSFTQRAKQQRPSSRANPIKPGAKVAAPLVYARVIRLWLVAQGRGRDVEHTRSNLG